MYWLFRSVSFLWSNLIDISFLHFNPVNGILRNCEQYYSGVWFVVLYKLDLTTESLDHVLLKKSPSNKSRWAVPSCGAVCLIFLFAKQNFIFLSSLHLDAVLSKDVKWLLRDIHSSPPQPCIEREMKL